MTQLRHRWFSFNLVPRGRREPWERGWFSFSKQDDPPQPPITHRELSRRLKMKFGLILLVEFCLISGYVGSGDCFQSCAVVLPKFSGKSSLMMRVKTFSKDKFVSVKVLERKIGISTSGCRASLKNTFAPYFRPTDAFKKRKKRFPVCMMSGPDSGFRDVEIIQCKMKI